MTDPDPQSPIEPSNAHEEALQDEVLAPATQGAEALGDLVADETSDGAPDHAENTGDNLRHAAQVQEQAQKDGGTSAPTEPGGPEAPLPDFNT